MSSFNLEYKDINRYQKKYHLINKDNNDFFITSDSPLEASYKLLKLQDTDTVSCTFDKAFSGIPRVIAGFVSLSPLLNNPSVNVYVESVTATGCVVKTSAPINIAAIAVHAIYIGDPAP